MALDCNSFWPHELHHWTHLTIIISIIAVLTVAINLLLIHSLFKTKQTRTNTFRFLIAMNISDLLQGALVMPATAITITIRDSHKNCHLDQATQFGFYLFGYFSYLMLMAIAIGRLYQLRRLRQFPKVLTGKQLTVLLGACFTVTVIWAYFGVAYISFKYQMALMVANICLISSVSVSYTRLIRKVRVHNLIVTKSLANANFQGHVQARVDTNASRVVWVLLAALIVTYVPFNVTTPWLTYVKYEKKQVPNNALSLATMWAYVLIFAYAFLNAVIFMKSNGKIRRFIWRGLEKFFRNRETGVYVTGPNTQTDGK